MIALLSVTPLTLTGASGCAALSRAGLAATAVDLPNRIESSLLLATLLRALRRRRLSFDGGVVNSGTPGGAIFGIFTGIVVGRCAYRKPGAASSTLRPGGYGSSKTPRGRFTVAVWTGGISSPFWEPSDDSCKQIAGIKLILTTGLVAEGN